jgi:carboxylesterase type B
MSHTAEYNLVYPGANFVLVDVEYRSGAFGFLAGTEVGKGRCLQSWTV